MPTSSHITWLPMLAVTLARKTNAPGASIIYEAGTIDGRPVHLPASVGDARCEYQASVVSGLFEVFNQLKRGSINLAFWGGAEIDKYGNVNTKAIGDYHKPQIQDIGIFIFLGNHLFLI